MFKQLLQITQHLPKFKRHFQIILQISFFYKLFAHFFKYFLCHNSLLNAKLCPKRARGHHFNLENAHFKYLNIILQPIYNSFILPKAKLILISNLQSYHQYTIIIAKTLFVYLGFSFTLPFMPYAHSLALISRQHVVRHAFELPLLLHLNFQDLYTFIQLIPPFQPIYIHFQLSQSHFTIDIIWLILNKAQ